MPGVFQIVKRVLILSRALFISTCWILRHNEVRCMSRHHVSEVCTTCHRAEVCIVMIMEGDCFLRSWAVFKSSAFSFLCVNAQREVQSCTECMVFMLTFANIIMPQSMTLICRRLLHPATCLYKSCSRSLSHLQPHCLNCMTPLSCWGSAGNEGMILVNHSLWLPSRESLGSFPHSPLSTSTLLLRGFPLAPL